MACELLCRTIQEVSWIAKEKGRDVPQHLVLVVDNTVAWGKNQTVATFLAYLVSSGHFHSTALFSLMKDHTHEDCDQWLPPLIIPSTNDFVHMMAMVMIYSNDCESLAKSSKSMTRFAIIKAVLVKSLEYQSPAEMKKIVAAGLWDKVEAKGEKFICQEVSTVRAFDEWLGPAPVAPWRMILRLGLHLD